MKLFLSLLLSLVVGGWLGTAAADPWKDESGHGRWRGGYDRKDGHRGKSHWGYDYGRPYWRDFDRGYRGRGYWRDDRRGYRYRRDD
jgi:hypothetical protein